LCITHQQRSREGLSATVIRKVTLRALAIDEHGDAICQRTECVRPSLSFSDLGFSDLDYGRGLRC
jgi:hypothetical protein